MGDSQQRGALSGTQSAQQSARFRRRRGASIGVAVSVALIVAVVRLLVRGSSGGQNHHSAGWGWLVIALVVVAVVGIALVSALARWRVVARDPALRELAGTERATVRRVSRALARGDSVQPGDEQTAQHVVTAMRRRRVVVGLWGVSVGAVLMVTGAALTSGPQRWWECAAAGLLGYSAAAMAVRRRRILSHALADPSHEVVGATRTR